MDSKRKEMEMKERERRERQQEMEKDQAKHEIDEREEFVSRMETKAYQEALEEEKLAMQYKTKGSPAKRKIWIHLAHEPSNGHFLLTFRFQETKRSKDIWSTLLAEKQEKGEDKSNVNEDFTMIVIGDKASGKSSLINKIHEKCKRTFDFVFCSLIEM
jgi:ribosome biogenesis GTPase A